MITYRICRDLWGEYRPDRKMRKKDKERRKRE